ncbi:MAG: aminotransferase class III-fold pyridoxal phosphate-dependent enzyme, partial [Thermomicrobiales bacterium]
GAYFRDQLRGLNNPKVREVRGRGLMIGVELKERATNYLRGLQEGGVLALMAGATTLRFLPPLLLTKADVDRAVAVFGGLLAGGAASGRDGAEA